MTNGRTKAKPKTKVTAQGMKVSLQRIQNIRRALNWLQDLLIPSRIPLITPGEAKKIGEVGKDLVELGNKLLGESERLTATPRKTAKRAAPTRKHKYIVDIGGALFKVALPMELKEKDKGKELQTMAETDDAFWHNGKPVIEVEMISDPEDWSVKKYKGPTLAEFKKKKSRADMVDTFQVQLNNAKDDGVPVVASKTK